MTQWSPVEYPEGSSWGSESRRNRATRIIAMFYARSSLRPRAPSNTLILPDASAVVVPDRTALLQEILDAIGCTRSFPLGRLRIIAC